MGSFPKRRNVVPVISEGETVCVKVTGGCFGIKPVRVVRLRLLVLGLSSRNHARARREHMHVPALVLGRLPINYQRDLFAGQFPGTDGFPPARGEQVKN